MSTCCLIGVVHGETIKTIYCHFDGYPCGVGEMLLEHYNSAKANHLVSLGNISYLEKEIEPPASVEHSFKNPADSVTVFYGRDRGKDRSGWIKFSSESVFTQYRQKYGHVYLMINEHWFYLPIGTKIANAELLKEII